MNRLDDHWQAWRTILESLLEQASAALTTAFSALSRWIVELLSQLPGGDTLSVAFTDVLTIMQQGGLPMWVLLVLGMLLWYALAARAVTLGVFSGRSPRTRVHQQLKKPRRRAWGLLGQATRDAAQAATDARRQQVSVMHRVEGAVLGYRHALSRHSILIKTIVIIAPLVGLLGTVLGMIETFDALQSMAVFSQGSSIAGGISQALFTTQMGLVVAVPGLLLGRLLDRRQRSMDDDIDQLVSLVQLRSRS